MPRIEDPYDISPSTQIAFNDGLREGMVTGEDLYLYIRTNGKKRKLFWQTMDRDFWRWESYTSRSGTYKIRYFGPVSYVRKMNNDA